MPKQASGPEMDYPIARCERCLGFYQKKRTWSRFCSRKCRQEAWAEIHPRQQGVARSRLGQLQNESRELRLALFVTHSCPGKYDRDEELRCLDCAIDFRRDSPQQIRRRLKGSSTVEDSGDQK